MKERNAKIDMSTDKKQQLENTVHKKKTYIQMNTPRDKCKEKSYKTNKQTNK